MLARCAAASLACLCWGCATTSPLRTAAPRFAEAEQHLRESVGRFTSPKVLAPDELLFLQAESFFHYRFELKRARSVGSYLAQAVAASTDFAPLTVLAASQGLFELRLRAYDGAAQLYSALVSEHPQSPLRPSALYRLGWACRSTSSDGFPCSSEGSFGALVREYAGSPLAPLARHAVRVPAKSLGRATMWSILPGAGQIYVGEALNGTVRLSVAAGFGALAALPILGMVRAGRFEWLPAALSLAGIVGLQVTYTTSYQDVQRAVLDFNERQEAAFEAEHPIAEESSSAAPRDVPCQPNDVPPSERRRHFIAASAPVKLSNRSRSVPATSAWPCVAASSQPTVSSDVTPGATSVATSEPDSTLMCSVPQIFW